MGDTDKFLRNLVLNYELEEDEDEGLKHPRRRGPCTEVYMDAKQLAEKLNVRREYIYRLVRQGRLRPIRVGRYLRFSKNSLERFIKQRRM